jgi:hypothetical protein
MFQQIVAPLSSDTRFPFQRTTQSCSVSGGTNPKACDDSMEEQYDSIESVAQGSQIVLKGIFHFSGVFHGHNPHVVEVYPELLEFFQETRCLAGYHKKRVLCSS